MHHQFTITLKYKHSLNYVHKYEYKVQDQEREETVSSNRVHKYKIHKFKYKYKIRTYTIRGGSVSCGKEQLFGFVRWLLLTTDPSVSWGLLVGFLGATNVATVHCSSIHKYAHTEIQILHTDNTNAIMNTTMTNENYLSWSLVVGFLCATNVATVNSGLTVNATTSSPLSCSLTSIRTNPCCSLYH